MSNLGTRNEAGRMTSVASGKVEPMSHAQGKNEGLMTALGMIAGVAVLTGIVIAAVLIGNAGRQAHGTKVAIAVGILFYHAVAATLCIGVAKALGEATQAAGGKRRRSTAGTRNEGLVLMLGTIGGLIVVVGFVLCVMALSTASQPNIVNPRGGVSGASVAVVAGIGFYHLLAAMLCFGVAKVLGEATYAATVADDGSDSGAGSPGAFRQQPGIPPETICANCGRTYATGDVHGQFCEACGRKL